MGYRLVALTVSTALFMQFLDSTALTVAIPAISRDFHVPAINLNVAILSYQLSMTVLIPVGAAITERIGQRNAFVMALFTFMIGSLCSAASTSLPMLVAEEIFQNTITSNGQADHRPEIAVFPNPTANGHVTITGWQREELIAVHVYDLSGREVMAPVAAADFNGSIDLPRRGVYLVALETKSGKIVRRVMW